MNKMRTHLIPFFILFTFGLFLFWTISQVFTTDDAGNITTFLWTVNSDWMMHLAQVQAFAHLPFWEVITNHPLYAGEVLSYPFFVNWFSGILLSISGNLVFSMTFPLYVGTALFLGGMYFLTYTLTKNKWIAVLTPFLFFFFSGFQGIMTLFHFSWKEFSLLWDYQYDLDFLVQNGFNWKSFLLTTYLPQRSFLWGMAMGTIILGIFVKMFERYRHSKSRSKRSNGYVESKTKQSAQNNSDSRSQIISGMTKLQITKITNENERKECHEILINEIYHDDFDSSFFDGKDQSTHSSESFVMRENNKIIGCFQLWEFEPKKYALLNLAIIKEHQKKSIGRNAIKYIENLILQKGGSKIYTNAEPDISEGFYKKLGFREKHWNDPYKDKNSISLIKQNLEHKISPITQLLPFFTIGLALGILSFIHTHTFFWFFFLFAGLFLVFWRQWKIFIATGLGAFVSSAPFVYLLSQKTGTVSEFSFFPLSTIGYPEWIVSPSLNGVEGISEIIPSIIHIPMYWTWNWGLVFLFGLLLLIPNIYNKVFLQNESPSLRGTEGEKISNPFLFPIFWISAILLILFSIVQLQGNPWDNTKVHLWSALFFSIATVSVLWYFFTKNIVVKFFSGLLLPFLIFGGIIQSVSGIDDETITVFSPIEQQKAEILSDHIPADALVLASDYFHHYFPPLTPNPVFMGYRGWISSYGMDWSGRVNIAKQIYSGSENALSLLQENEIEYVLTDFSAAGVYDTLINFSFFDTHLKKVLEFTDGTVLYKIL